MEFPQFQLFDLSLMDPVGTGIDWLLAFECFLFAFLLKNPEGKSGFLWKRFFQLYGVSLIFGGFSHLLYNYTGEPGKLPGWTFAIIGLAVGEFALLIALRESRIKRLLSYLVIIKFIACTFMALYSNVFIWVILSTLGFTILSAGVSISLMKSGIKEYRWFIYSALTTLVLAPVFLLKVKIHPLWFNQNDLSHSIMILTFLFLYFGARATSGRGLTHK